MPFRFLHRLRSCPLKSGCVRLIKKTDDIILCSFVICSGFENDYNDLDFVLKNENKFAGGIMHTI